MYKVLPKALKVNHCSGCLLPTSEVQNLDHTQGTCDGPGTAQNAAQHKLKL